MRIDESTAPYEKKEFIMYARDGNTVLHSKKIVQPLEDNFYRSKAEYSSYGRKLCDMYYYYPQFGIGIYLFRMETFRELSEAREKAETAGLLSRDAYTKVMLDRIHRKQHIKLLDIELLKYYDPSMVDLAVEAREQFLSERNIRLAQENARRESETREMAERGRKEADEMIRAAIHTILHGGELQNDRITVYDSDDDYSTYSIINYLMREYGMDVPLRTQGWINNKLLQCRIANGNCTSYAYQKRTIRENGSKTFLRYMNNLITAVKTTEKRGEPNECD